MIRPIIAYGDPILKKKAAIININESNELTSLIDDMWETMYNAKGVGIAAPQIGVSKSIFVADFSFFEEEENFKSEELTNMQQVFINPEIISEAGEDFIYPEGCLSIPNISENVVRKSIIKIKFLDQFFVPHEMHCSGIIARVIQHEHDHLNGLLFTDKLSYKTRKLIKKELNLISNGDIDMKYDMKFYKKEN